MGRYYTAFVREAGVHFMASHHGGPPFYLQSVAVASDAANPRMVVDAFGRLWLCWERVSTGDTLLTWSSDSGETWETSVVAIAGGKKPTLGRGIDGTLIVAAHVGGVLHARVRPPAGGAWGDEFVVQGWNGLALVDFVIEDDTFNIEQEYAPSGRWWIHAVVQGESGTSNWWSSDLMQTLTRGPT